MAKRNGRDWSEWKEHITGMHRLGSDNFKQPHLGTRRYEQTHTSITMPKQFYDRKEAEPSIRIWIIVFLCALLARKCYFEFTKHSKLKGTAAPISRVK